MACIIFVYAYVLYWRLHPNVFNINKLYFYINALIILLSCFWKQIPRYYFLKMILWFKININRSVFSGRELGMSQMPLICPRHSPNTLSKHALSSMSVKPFSRFNPCVYSKSFCTNRFRVFQKWLKIKYK